MLNKKLFVLGIILIIALATIPRILSNNMAEPTWGQLEKAQDDNETIEQAIARLVDAHLADAAAHANATESLAVHKTQTIVDHPAGSIVKDKIPDWEIPTEKLHDFERIRISLPFESIDTWDKSAGISAGFHTVELRTDGTNNNYQYMIGWSGLLPLWDKKQEALFMFWNWDFSTVRAYIIVGTYQPNSSDGQNIGFKIINNAVYAVHNSYYAGTLTEYTTLLSGINSGNRHTYRYDYYPGVKIDFYVDSVLKATHSSNLPSSAQFSYSLFDFNIRALTAAVYVLNIELIYFARDI